eukprot:102353-Hanusia_phi.AAC.1
MLMLFRNGCERLQVVTPRHGLCTAARHECMAIVKGPGGGGCDKMGGSGGSDRSVQRRVGYSRGIGFDSHTQTP